jgi:hypothetical protein
MTGPVDILVVDDLSHSFQGFFHLDKPQEIFFVYLEEDAFRTVTFASALVSRMSRRKQIILAKQASLSKNSQLMCYG